MGGRVGRVDRVELIGDRRRSLRRGGGRRVDAAVPVDLTGYMAPFGSSVPGLTLLYPVRLQSESVNGVGAWPEIWAM